jgi:hypothetical protein
MEDIRMKRCLAVGIILLFVGTCIIPAIAQDIEEQPLPNNDTWWRTYGGPSWDLGFCLKQTTDGGYIIAGESSFYDSSGDTEGLLIKTDAEGIKIWDKIYGAENPSTESLPSVCQTSDGGYILAGYRYPPDSDYQLTWLIKTDAYGNEIWNKSYQFVEFSIAWSVVETFDEGFLAVGEIYHYSPNMNSSALLLKVDKDGNEIWNKTYGGYLQNEFRKIKNTADGGFIVAGVKYNESLNDSYPWLLKLDKYGEEQWNTTYIFNKNILYVYDVLQTNDGGYAIIGDKADYFHIWYNGWMIKTDTDGNKEWIRDYQKILVYNTPHSFYQTRDGGYILTGETLNLLQYIITGEFRIDLWLAKTDETGRVKWSKSLNKKNNTNNPYPYSLGTAILQASDGGYVVLGGSNSESSDENDFNIWLIKTNKYGVSIESSTFQVANSINYRFLERFSITVSQSCGNENEENPYIRCYPLVHRFDISSEHPN